MGVRAKQRLCYSVCPSNSNRLFDGSPSVIAAVRRFCFRRWKPASRAYFLQTWWSSWKFLLAQISPNYFSMPMIREDFHGLINLDCWCRELLFNHRSYRSLLFATNDVRVQAASLLRVPDRRRKFPFIHSTTAILFSRFSRTYFSINSIRFPKLRFSFQFPYST